MRKFLTAIIISFLVSIPLSANADWSIKGLGTLGGESSSAVAINDTGQVLGTSSAFVGPPRNFLPHAFLTGPDGVGITDLGTAFNNNSTALISPIDVNNSGQVVGDAHDTDLPDFEGIFITGSNGTNMKGFFGNQLTHSAGINNSGQVALFREDVFEGTWQAFISNPDNSRIFLESNGSFGNIPSAINESGQVVGISGDFFFNSHAYITGPNEAGITDLGTLGGPSSSASDINNSGQVVGHSTINQISEFTHAFITGPDGVNMTDLGTLGGIGSIATSINNLGEVVGRAQTANGDSHTFLFSHGGITDLNLLDEVIAGGWIIQNIEDINNNGQMVGTGINSQGNTEAFLLSYTADTIFDPKPIFIPSIPEPQTYAMLLVGLFAIFGFAKQRQFS